MHMTTTLHKSAYNRAKTPRVVSPELSGIPDNPNAVSREAGAMRGAPLLRCRKAADGRERCQKRHPAPRSARLDFNCDF